MMVNNKKPLILGFANNHWGCGYYRFFIPFKALQNILGYSISTRSDNCTSLSLNYDIYWMQRPVTIEKKTTAAFLKDNGKKLIIDLDDDLFSPMQDERAVSGEYGENLLNLVQSLNMADLIITTNSEMEKRIREFVNKDIPILILPNCVEKELYLGVNKKGDDWKTIGWAGSYTHEHDLTQLIPGVHVLNKYDEYTLVIAGEDDDKVFEIFGHFIHNKDNIYTLNTVPVHVYPHLLYNLDIGLIPLYDSYFNRGKSDIKLVEYGLAGIPTIASNIPPYSESNGVFVPVNSRSEWGEKIEMLINDVSLQKKLAKENYEFAISRDIAYYVNDLDEAILGIL